MNKLKIAVAALIIAAGTFGAFAFSDANNVEPVTEEAPTIYWYGNNGDGTYRYLPNGVTGDCEEPASNPCKVSSSELHQGGFSVQDMPSDANPEGGNFKYVD